MFPSIYQILLASIALILGISALSKFLKQEHGQTFFKTALAFWIWGSVFTFSLFPNLVYKLSKTLGLGSNLNTLIFIGFVLTFMILFKIINALERTERNISELVRKETLKDLKNDEHS